MTETFEDRKQRFSAAIHPRKAARDYEIVHPDGRSSGPQPWGVVMASAMRTLRAGAEVVDHGHGRVSLVLAGGSVTLEPVPHK